MDVFEGPIGRAPLGDALRRLDALDLDARARDAGARIAQAIAAGGFDAMIVHGPSFSGKTQAAIAARAVIDPSGDESLHTSAAILNTNATLAPSDRSARWQTWTDALRFKEAAPKLVVIDEAGSSPCPSPPRDLQTSAASRLLLRWRDAGTKFIIIGHDPDRPSPWAKWLSRGAYATCDARTGALQTIARTTAAEGVDLPPDAKANPIAAKNALGAEGGARMRRRIGNALFTRAETWAPAEPRAADSPRAVLAEVLAAQVNASLARLENPNEVLSVRNQIQIALAQSTETGTPKERMMAWIATKAGAFSGLLQNDPELTRMLVAAWPTHKEACLAEVRRCLGI